MATSAEVFRLTRRNAHQLPDMRTIVHQQSLRPALAHTSLELPILRRASPSSSTVAQSVEWSRSRPTVRRGPLPTSHSHTALDSDHHSRQSYRLTRTVSEMARPTRSYFSSSSFASPSYGSTGARHHSLVAMRTYYAFGARSMHTLDRPADYGSNVSLSTYGLHGTSSSAYDTYTPSSLRRSYQSPYTSSTGRRTPTSSLTSSTSAYDRYYSAKSKSSGYSSSLATYTPSSTTYTPSSTTYTPSSTTYSPSSATYTPSSATYIPSSTTAYTSSPSSLRSSAYSSSYHRTSSSLAPYTGSKTATSVVLLLCSTTVDDQPTSSFSTSLYRLADRN